MKFTVMLKDPDTFYDCISEAVEKEVKALGLDDDERDSVQEIRREKTSKAISKWVEYGEYITIEFDTDAGTATVVPAKR